MAGVTAGFGASERPDPRAVTSSLRRSGELGPERYRHSLLQLHRTGLRGSDRLATLARARVMSSARFLSIKRVESPCELASGMGCVQPIANCWCPPEKQEPRLVSHEASAAQGARRIPSGGRRSALPRTTQTARRATSSMSSCRGPNGSRVNPKPSSTPSRARSPPISGPACAATILSQMCGSRPRTVPSSLLPLPESVEHVPQRVRRHAQHARVASPRTRISSARVPRH